MIQRNLAFKLVATLVVVSLQGLMLPVVASEPDAGVQGSILSTDETPLVGAKLHLGDPKTGQIYSSALTGTDGGFEIDRVPPSTYEIAVESDGGLYLVETPLKLVPGQSRSLQVAINPQLAPAQVAPSPEEQEKEKKKKGGGGVWNNPLTAALIVVGAAIVIGLIINEATDDDEPPPASPS